MEDEILVQQLKKGSREAFDLLYEKYKNLVIRTAYLITGNKPDSEDVAQETFVKVYLHITELKNDAGFKPWMMRILVRTAYRTGKKKSREVPDDEIERLSESQTLVSPLGQMIKREEAEMISRAVAALPVLAELCLPLVKPGGQFLSMKSVDCGEELNAAGRAVHLLGGRMEKPQDYVISGTNIRHRLVIMTKISETPKKYPRTFAKIKKNPL